jgi:MFS family permease
VTAAQTDQPTTARAATASMIGTSLEWYDFMIYNTMAALVFNRLFFPAAEPMVGTLLAFSTYAVGYVSRPLGGVVFGRMGDRLGRRAVLIATLVVMGVATAGIAILPTYRMIGAASPCLLVLLRLVQGLALGGEWAGAVLLSVEHGRPDRKGLNASWAQVGPAAGVLLSSAVIGLITLTVSRADFLAWGWRIPFALSGFLVVVGVWIRAGVGETPGFEALRSRGEVAMAPVGEVLRTHKRALLVAGASRIGPDVVYALLVVFSVTYATQVLHLPNSTALIALLVGAALNLAATPIFGAMTDRFGRRAIFACGLLAAAPLAMLFFPLADSRSAVVLTLTIGAGMVIHASMYAAQGAFIMEQFAPRVRYTGSSIAYTFGSLAGGGAFAPLIMASLLRQTASTVLVSGYVLLALAVSGLGLAFARGGPSPISPSLPRQTR